MNRDHRLRSDCGSVSVTTLMVPFIIVATMLIIQFGLTLYASQVMSGAAQDGAAHAALDGSSPGAGLAVTDGLVGGSGGHLITGYRSSVTSTGAIVTITASAEVVSLVPLLPSITVTGTGSATIEEFRVQER